MQAFPLVASRWALEVAGCVGARTAEAQADVLAHLVVQSVVQQDQLRLAVLLWTTTREG